MDDRRWGPLPRVSTDGDAPLPFRVVRGAPFDWLPRETHGFARNEHLLRISVEQVIDTVGELLGA
jgi:hypothetical protein